MNMASFEPDQNTPKAFRFGVLVVASHHKVRERQDRFSSMIGESPGNSGLSHFTSTSFDGLPDGGCGWRAKPVPAKRSGPPPRLVKRDTHQVRLSETQQPRLLVLTHFVKVSP